MAGQASVPTPLRRAPPPATMASVGRQLSEGDGLTAGDITHRRVSPLPGSTTVGELRDYFAGSASRRVALLVDGDRYLGSIGVSAIDDAVEPSKPAADYASREPSIEPEAPATTARDMA